MAEPAIGDLATRRITMLRGDERALENMYRWFWGFSGVAVVCGIAAPVLAGSALLKTFGDPWNQIVGIFVLTATLLTAVHKGLECEKYQRGCRKVLMDMRTIMLAYDNLKLHPPREPARKYRELETRLAAFYKNAADVLPMRLTCLPKVPPPLT